MPVVRTAPTQTPNIETPSAYFQPQAGAEAFGYGAARALGNLGTTLERASDTAAISALQQQRLYNEVTSDDQVNQVQDRINRIIYGDPDVDGDTGFVGTRGSNAMRAFPLARGRVDEIINEHSGMLRNDAQRLRFNRAVRDYRLNVFNTMSRHYDRELFGFAEDEAKARSAINKSAVGVAAGAGDFSGWRAALGRGLLDVEERGKRLGLPPEAVIAEKNKFTQGAAREWAEALAVTDPLKAQQFIENNKAMLPDYYPELASKVRARAFQAQALQDAFPGAGIDRAAPVGDVGDRMAVTLKQRGWSDAAIIGALNNALSESSFAMRPGAAGEEGYFQFHPGSHLPLFKKNYGGDWSPEAQANYVADDIERTMPDYKNESDPTNATARFLRGFEKPKDQSNAELMRRAANTTAAQTILGRLGTKIGALPPLEPNELPDAQIPGLTAKLEEVLKNLPPDASRERKWAAVKTARQVYNMQYAAQRNQDQLERAQRDKIDSAAVNEYIERTTSDSANFPTEDQIKKDPRLTEASKLRMLNFLTAQSKQGPPTDVSNANQSKLFNRIHLEEGDPNRITSERQLIDAYSKEGLINRTAFDRLMEDFQKANMPAKALVERKKADLIRAAEPVLRPSKHMGDGELVVDPGAVMRELKYKNFLDEKVREYEKANKSPLSALSNPDDPDFLGKRSVVEQHSVIPESLGYKRVQPGDYKSWAEVIADVPKKLSPEQARIIGIQKGFIQPRPAVPVR